MNDESGIYVLYRRGDCLYVGQSIHMRRRVKTHSRKVGFDRAEYHPCAKSDLSINEQTMIQKLHPSLNKLTACQRLTKKRVRICIDCKRFIKQNHRWFNAAYGKRHHNCANPVEFPRQLAKIIIWAVGE